MDRAQVIKELKALKEAFEEERDAYPICLEEAIRLLEQQVESLGGVRPFGAFCCPKKISKII